MAALPYFLLALPIVDLIRLYPDEDDSILLMFSIDTRSFQTWAPPTHGRAGAQSHRICRQ